MSVLWSCQQRTKSECSVGTNIVLISFLPKTSTGSSFWFLCFYRLTYPFSSSAAQTHRRAGHHSSHAEVRRLVRRINAGVYCEYKNNVFSASNDALSPLLQLFLCLFLTSANKRKRKETCEWKKIDQKQTNNLQFFNFFRLILVKLFPILCWLNAVKHSHVSIADSFFRFCLFFFPQPEFYQVCHTKKDYEEIGPSICRHNPVFGVMS